MAAFRQGRFARIMVSGVDISAFSDSVDFDMSVDMLETTTFTKTNKTYLTGLGDTKVDISGKYVNDPLPASGPNALFPSLLGASNSIFCQYYPGGNQTGQLVRNFNGFVVDYKETSPVADVVNWKASLLVDGPVTVSGL